MLSISAESQVPSSIETVVDSKYVLVSSPVMCLFRYRRHTEAEVGVAVPAMAAPQPKMRLDEH